MSKRIIIICCAIIIIFSLTGCQLAREDGLVAQTDSLAGVFITTEYLDLLIFRDICKSKTFFYRGDVFIIIMIITGGFTPTQVQDLYR